MSQIFQLYRLQQIDLQLDQSTNRLKELTELINDDTDLRQAQQNYTHQEDIVKDSERKLRLIERDVKQQNIKIEQCESTLYGGRIKNPKELKDREEELKALKRYLEVLEDRQLEAMIALEEETKTLHDIEKNLNETKQALYQRNSRYLGEKSELEKEIHRLENERSVAISGINPHFYERYQSIRKSKNGIAVCRIQDKCCSACGTTLTGGLIQESRIPDRIVLCPSCGRILYGG
ncbi:MAG: C4-type zinc ribbon domain-containing protein [Anaerolineales bacterium]